jgi:hypothetical protein
MWIGPAVAILLLLSLLAATTTLEANAVSKVPPTCDESSDDKECATFQVMVNQSHSQQPHNLQGIATR